MFGIKEDSKLQKKLNSNSDSHYCYDGTSKQHARMVATTIAGRYQDAGKTPDVAVCPHPTRPGSFVVEDRTEK